MDPARLGYRMPALLRWAILTRRDNGRGVVGWTIAGVLAGMRARRADSQPGSLSRDESTRSEVMGRSPPADANA